MDELIQQLRENLLNELEGVREDSSPVKGSDEKRRITRRYIEELKTHMTNYEFRTGQEEIDYYKIDSVFFYQLYFAQDKQYNLEVARITSTVESFKQYLEREMLEVEGFFRKHQELVLYFFSGDCYLDDKLFVRHSPGISGQALMEVILDNSICTGAHLLAWCKVYQEYKKVLEDVASGKEGPSPNGQRYKWSCSIADATEVITALHLKKAITVNGKEASLKQLVHFWESSFNISLGNFYDRKRINNKRKKDAMPFLNSLINGMGGGKEE